MSTLAGRLPELGGATTARSERFLGIRAASTYWYVHRAAAAYGRAVTFWQPLFDPASPPEGGITPFDSGGVASRRIERHPPFSNDDERRSYFHRRTRPLNGWERRVTRDIGVRWASLGAYVMGERPRTEDELTRVATNTDRAWSWEARVSKTDVTDTAVTLTRLFVTAEDKSAFSAWFLSDLKNIPTDEAARVGKAVGTAVTSDSPAAAANAALSTST